MEVESRNLVALHGSRIPEMLGTFHLDDHNVQEWSDASKPGLKHRARKEVGKWIDNDRNADIQFQRREDSKQSERGREQQRTEVIKGSAPDAHFQIVRTHRKFDEDSGARVSTMSTSYQMSSTRGTHSTTKTTSNKTTTKTVTVTGGRSEDFDTIKSQPLDNSTQRERINVSRSGTMGVRRPPTRRHTPAAVLPSSPELQEEDVMGTTVTDDDLDDSVRISEVHSPVPPIVGGFKNISPKIRVGFPVEIQLELQSKLRYSNGGGSGIEHVHNIERNDDDEQIKIDSSTRLLSSSALSASNTTKTATTLSSSTPPTLTISDSNIRSNKIQQESSTKTVEAENSHESIDANESADSLFLPIPMSNSVNNNGDLNFDFSTRRKSYGFESFETQEPQATPNSEEAPSNSQNTSNNNNNNNINSSSNSSSIYNKAIPPVKSYERLNLTPPSLSRSWDLIQSVTNAQQRREANKKLFSSSSTLDDLRTHLGTKQSSGNSAPQKTIITLNAFDIEENDGDGDSDVPEISNRRRLSHEFTLDSLETNPSFASKMNNSRRSVSFDNIEKSQNVSPPDIIHHNVQEQPSSDDDNNNNKSSTILSSSDKSSRNIIKLLDDTPDLLNKMSFKHYYPPSFETIETKPQTTSSVGFLNLNESLNRILRESKDLYKTNNDTSSPNSSKYSYGKNEPMPTVNRNLVRERNHLNMNNNSRAEEEQEDFDFDQEESGQNHKKTTMGKPTQVSHTWISAIDQKNPSQHARDNDVTTTISATNDPFKRAQKKVEFCKTEVHFIPDSGKFHIVETDDNKPSTVHLFRRKKRGDKKSTPSSTSSPSPTSTNSTETKKLVEKFSEKRDKLNHEETTQEERKLHNTILTGSSTKLGKTIGTEFNNNSEGLERVNVKKSAMVDVVGVDDDKKNSLFQHWTAEQDAKPELGIDEETVTPTTTTPNNISTSLNHHRNRELNNQIELNFDNDDKILDTTAGQQEVRLLPSLELRRDKKKNLLANDFDELIIHQGGKRSHRHSYNNNNNNRGTSQRVLNQNTYNATLINDLLNDLGDDGEDGDESRTGMILSNYGDELKIQRYLKQLKSPSSHTGSESPTDFLQFANDEDSGDPDQVDIDDVDDDDTKHDRFDNVLYENGSFVPRATRRSLIEMNNRNRKRGSHSHASDNSSTTSNYSLPHSDSKGDYHQPFKLSTMDDVATVGKPQVTSGELRYPFALDKEKNSYFSEPVKRNFKILPKDNDKKEEEHIYDLPTPVKPVELRSLPPYNKNGRFPVSSNAGEGLPTVTPTSRDYNAYNHSKPPTPIFPSLFSSFEKTGMALRKRASEGKNQSSTTNISSDEKKLEESNDKSTSVVQHKNLTETIKPTKSEPNYIPSKSIVRIGGDENFDNHNKKKVNMTESDYGHHHSSNEEKSEEVGIDGITISPELLLNMDGTWQGPAHQPATTGAKGTSVMRSMTFPKSRAEPEWITKARSREARDWSLIGSKQSGNCTTTRNSEPPWISELRLKSKVVTPSTDAQSLPKISVYPWQQRGALTETKNTEKEAENTVENIQDESKKHCPRSYRQMDQTINNGDVEIIELLPNDVKDNVVTSKTKKILQNTEYSTNDNNYHHSTRNNKSMVDMNRDSDTILIDPIQIPVTDTGVSLKERKIHKRNHKNNSNSPDYSTHSIDKKLFAPLLESSKQPRKPLSLSSSANKNNTNYNNNNNNKVLPSDKLKKPPRPPPLLVKPIAPPPPLRTSSLNSKSEMTDRTNKRSQAVEEAMVTPSRSNHSVQVHRHPLVQVKLPTTKTSVIITNHDGKTKARHHVSLINEGKGLCAQTESPNRGSQRTSPTLRTATIASPHRKR